MSSAENGKSVLSEFVTWRTAVQTVVFIAVQAALLKLIDDLPVWLRLVTVLTGLLALVALSIGSRRNKGNFFDILAALLGIGYAAVVVYGVAVTGEVKLPVLDPLWVLGMFLWFVALLLIAGIALILRDYRARRMSADLFWPLICTVGVTMMIFVSVVLLQRQVQSLRADFGHYAMPRHLTDEQVKNMTAYLQTTTPQILIIKFPIGDSEAGEYKSQFSGVFQAGGWKVSEQAVHESDLENASTGEGMEVQTEYPPNAQDKELPLITEALKRGNLDCGSGSGTGPSSLTQEIGTIIIGHRPRTYHPPMMLKPVPIDD
jgi:hypothetical protein